MWVHLKMQRLLMVKGYDTGPMIYVARTLSYTDWQAEGHRRFGGPEREHWKFICPLCKKIIMMEDYDEHGIDRTMIPRICIANNGLPCKEMSNIEWAESCPLVLTFGGDSTLSIFDFYFERVIESPCGDISIGRELYGWE